MARRVEHALQIVLEELITNSVRHGPGHDHSQGSGASSIDVHMTVDGSTVKFAYVDRATPFNPHCDLPPDTREVPVEQRDVGGLGWPLILHYCELYEYWYVDGENHYGLALKAN